MRGIGVSKMRLPMSLTRLSFLILQNSHVT